MLNPETTLDGKYRIARLIGEGGMGAVYEGVHTLIHRRVAIKVLHPSVSDRNEAVTRFEREAQAAGRIGSQHIVEVLDLGSLPSGARYLVMEFLEGESLSSRLHRRGTLEPSELVPIVCQLLRGVAAAHAAGIIHRDLKPDNVFLQRREPEQDFVKILDFGISKFSHLGDGSLDMTSTGAVMGTPYYMAPEQARGASQVDHRADIYAVGVILYECLSGRVPFDGASFNDLMFKIVLEEAPRLADIAPRVDPALAQIAERAMSRDPERRYASAAALREAIESWARGALPLAAFGTNTPGPILGNTADARLATNDSWARSGSSASIDPLFGDPPRKRSRTALWVVLGVVAVAAAGALVIGSIRLVPAEPAPSASIMNMNGAPSAIPAAPSEPVEPAPAAPEVQPIQELAAKPEPLPETEPITPARAEPARPRAPAPLRPAKSRTRPPEPQAPISEPQASPKAEPSPPKAEPTNKVKIGDRPIRTTF